MHPTDLGKKIEGPTTTQYLHTGDLRESDAHQHANRHGFVEQDVNLRRPSDEARTADLFFSHGGSLKHVPRTRDFWATQPVHQVNTDTPLSTTQSPFDTRDDRISKIQSDLESGGRINRPAWLVKDQGRLFVLDGHHRITASRQAGSKQFPAHVWDRDAQTGWTPKQSS